MRYAVVLEKAARNYSAYVQSVAQTLASLREALTAHFKDMLAEGESIPDPSTLCDYVDVDVSAPELAKKNGLRDRFSSEHFALCTQDSALRI